MAQQRQQRSLKGFYLILGVVVVIGGGFIVWNMRQAGAPVVMPTTGIPLDGDSLPPAAYVMGSDTAPVVVDEWSDFECPYCAQLAVLILPDVKRRLVETGLVRWRFRDFPLNIHANAPTAHLAGACAAEQGQFWPMHDVIYYNQSEWARGGVRGHMSDYAREVGLDMGAFESCMNEQGPLTRIAQTLQRGQAIGVSGTPTIFINGQLYRGRSLSFDALREAIEAAAAP